MHERPGQPIDQGASHLPGGHEVKARESLLKEGETEDETDEELVNEPEDMKKQPGTTWLCSQLTKKHSTEPPQPAWHFWHASKQT